MLAINVLVYLSLQIAACLCFKWGSSLPERYWWGFAFGSTVTLISILLLINIYKALPPSAAMATASGGAFVCCQIALLVVFRQPVPPVGWCGIGLILSGVLLFAFAK